MEKYCKSCGRVFDDLNFKLCPYCGSELAIRYGRQPIPRKLRHEVFKRDGYRCRECGASKDETSLEIDHILPVAKGGTNDIDNLQTLCRECNRMKHTDEWVGGETDSTQIKQLIDIKKGDISNLEQNLNSLSDENEIIDCRYKIMKLNEEVDILSIELEGARMQEAKNLQNHIDAQEREQLYKNIYVSVTDEELNNLKKELKKFNYTTKEQYVKYLFDISSPEFDKAIKHINAGEYYEATLIFGKLEEFVKGDYIWYLNGKCFLEMFIKGLKVIPDMVFPEFNAERCFEKAIEINPFNDEVKLKLAELNYEKYGDTLEFDTCNKLLDKYPNWSEAWLLKGRISFSPDFSSNPFLKVDSNEALTYFDKSIESDSNNVDAWFYKGEAYDELKQYSKMLDCYEKAILLDPNHDKSLNGKGQYYLNQLEDYDKALTFFNKAIAINPNIALYWKNKALCHDFKDEKDDAINAYDKSSKLNPDDFEVESRIVVLENIKWKESLKF